MHYECVTCGTPIVGNGEGCSHLRSQSPWPCIHGGHVGLGLSQYDSKKHSSNNPPECSGAVVGGTPCHCSCHLPPATEEEVTEAINGLLSLAAATKPKGTNGLRSPNVGRASQHEA